MSALIAAFVAIRILALYLVVVGIMALPQIAWMWPMTDPDGSRAFGTPYVILSLMPLLFGLLVWFSAPFLSRLTVPNSKADAEIPIPVAESLVRIIFVVFGIYLLVTAIPGLGVVVVQAIERSSGIVSEVPLSELLFNDRSIWPQLVAVSLKITVGLGFLVGNTGLARFVQFARKFALDK